MSFPYKKIAKRLKQGGSTKKTKVKGEVLEDVASWTFCSLDGVRVLKRDFKDVAGGIEVDLFLFNDHRSSPVPFLSHYLLVECKNWDGPVDSATVRDFIEKLRTFKLTVGILVTAKGVTGDVKDQTAANDTIRKAFDADAIIIIVIKRSDIEKFRSVEDFVIFLQEKYGEAVLRSTSIS